MIRGVGPTAVSCTAIRKELLIWNTLKAAERSAFQQRAEEQLQRQ